MIFAIAGVIIPIKPKSCEVARASGVSLTYIGSSKKAFTTATIIISGTKAIRMNIIILFKVSFLSLLISFNSLLINLAGNFIGYYVKYKNNP